jgi:2-iminobutanoate/2-iminopropanoate deaminase
MSIERIDLNNPDREFTFSSCVIAGDYVFTSHHGGYDFENDRWPESVEEQTKQCFKNLQRTLETAGVTLNDVVRTTVLLKNPGDFEKVKNVYRRVFTDGYPARTTIISDFLAPEILIQIDAVAYKPK